jgi:diguanylate cyclase (GGDEF)-like protein
MATVGDPVSNRQAPKPAVSERRDGSPAHELPDDVGHFKDYVARRLGTFIRAQLVAGVVAYCFATIGHFAIESPRLPLWLIAAPALAMAFITLAVWRTRSSTLLSAASVVYVFCVELGVLINALSWTDGVRMALPFFVLIPLVTAVVLAQSWDFALATVIAVSAPLAFIALHPDTQAMRIYYALYMLIAVSMSVVTNIFAVRFYRKNYRHERQLRAFADIDELTQLPRRRRVVELAKRILQRCERSGLPACVLYLDADNFKSINDIFGHDAGDRALTLIATQIQEAIRPADVAGRFGGEEFIVFLPGADLPVATKIAERLRKRIENIKNFEAILTVSVGVAQHVKGHDIHHVIQAADGALLHAKRTGRNRVTIADTPMRVHELPASVTDHAAENGREHNEQNAAGS